MKKTICVVTATRAEYGLLKPLIFKFKEDKEWIEEHYRIIINKMSKSLVTHTVDIDEQKLINEVEKRLYESKETAYKIVNNNFFKSSSYYTDYINNDFNKNVK